MKLLWNIVCVMTLLDLGTLAESTASEVSDIKEELSRLENLIDQNNRKCDKNLVAMETRLEEMEGKLEEAEKIIETLTNGLGSSIKARQASAYRVAFSTYLSANSNNNKIIPFDRVILNAGGSFSSTTHQFTCPVFGIYVFQSAVLAERATMVQTEIVKNGVGLVTQYAAGSTGSHGFDQGFNSVVIQCSIGDKVWVQIYGDYGTEVYASRYSTFSGFLLSQM